MAEKLRLSKVMADRKIASRREADEWIQKGWVKVDGVVHDNPAERVEPLCHIELSPEARKESGDKVTVIINKPIGYVSAQAEDGYEPAIVLVTSQNRWREENKVLRPSHLKGLAPAGRLDIDSQGLLLLTQDGRVAKHIIGENSEIEKEYIVRVSGHLSEVNLKRLNFGLELDGEALKPARVEWLNDDQLRFILKEGKKRQIRRMCEMVGLRVNGLKRVRIGNLRLGQLPEGQWRFLKSNEVI